MRTSLILMAVLLLPGFASADIANEVRCQEIAFSQSVETKDVVAFRSFIATDARFIGQSVQRGVAEIVTAWGVFFTDSAPDFKWRPQFVEVLEDGTLALSRGPYRLIIKNEDGTTAERWGTFNSIWRKQDDGNWKIIFDAGNEAAETPDDEVQALLDKDYDCSM